MRGSLREGVGGKAREKIVGQKSRFSRETGQSFPPIPILPTVRVSGTGNGHEGGTTFVLQLTEDATDDKHQARWPGRVPIFSTKCH